MTKKLLVLVMMFLILILTVRSWSAPRLVCDPQEGVTHYKLEINSVILIPEFNAQPDGSADIDLGLLGIVEGPVIFRLKAKNLWGVSEWSDPLSETKELPLFPSGERLEP